MKKLTIMLLVFLLLATMGVAAQKGGGSDDDDVDTGGISVTCDDGSSFDNGVKVIVNMRSGFTYRAVALGINGFDPILAVLGEDGEGLCTDDTEDAAAYSANLVTSGAVDVSSFNSHIFFSNTSDDTFADISLIVGGYGNTGGEFLLILEEMYITESDLGGSQAVPGDPFSIYITDEMVASEVPITVYVIANTDELDPFVVMVDSDGEMLSDVDENVIYCDDAGDADYCWSGLVDDLGDQYIAVNDGEFMLGLYGTDAILTLPLEEGYEGGYFNLIVTSSLLLETATYGEYTMIFHIGVAEMEE
jgi:hypothetical protein